MTTVHKFEKNNMILYSIPTKKISSQFVLNIYIYIIFNFYLFIYFYFYFYDVVISALTSKQYGVTKAVVCAILSVGWCI